MCSRALFISCVVSAARVNAQPIFDEGGQIYFPGQVLPGNRIPGPRPIPAALVTQAGRRSAEMCKMYATLCVNLHRFGGQGSIDTYDEDDYDGAETLTGNGTSVDHKEFPDMIVNGTDAEPTEFPHMALIGFESLMGVQWKCGGSLISEQFVLSAAHCNARRPTRVRLGDYNIKSEGDEEAGYSKPEEFNIVQVIQHPEYNASRTYNDITLYKLDRVVVFNKFIRPICLHTEYKIPISAGIISGWGGVEYGGPVTNILQKGNVSFVSKQECSNALDASLQQSMSEVKDEMMLCAANYETGSDACQGDSGGPLQYRKSGSSCMYIQVGITSFGVKCGNYYGQPKYPAIYTRVSTYVPWIESIVWP